MPPAGGERMEQMTNLRDVTELDRERGASWRRIGGVAAELLGRAEARRDEAARRDEPVFVPVAWAAE